MEPGEEAPRETAGPFSQACPLTQALALRRRRSGFLLVILLGDHDVDPPGEKAVEITGESLDEVLIATYEKLLASGRRNTGTRGDTIELIGVTLRIEFPRARLSRSLDRARPFSALGELLWYLTGSDDVEFIAAYIPHYRKEVGNSGRINGAYGPRLFSKYDVNQIEAVTELLRRKPSTRRAVIQVYSAADLLTDEEVPCTTTLQFHLRENRLHLSVTLRSNDAYLGLPHDVFCFTMIQEMMARRLGVDLGEYIQMVGSMHMYTKDESKVERYRREGHHRLAEMPAMPSGDPFGLIPRLHAIEAEIRRGNPVDALLADLDPYWADIMRLVQIHFASNDDARLDSISAALHERSYTTYLEDRRGKAPPQTA
jgi:thymidylate synthase